MYKNRQEYDAAKVRLNMLISEATAKGMLESDMDNEYTREIGTISAEMADYEDEVLKVMTPITKKTSASQQKVSYRVSMPVYLHDSVAQKASQLGQTISAYVSAIMARELNVAL